MTAIEIVDTRAGTIVMNGLVGNCLELFEIRIQDGDYHYWVGELEVTREAYLDSLDLAVKDRFEPKPEDSEEPQPEHS